MAAMDVPVPFSPVLEDQTVPTPAAIADRARALLEGRL
jgi:pyruvate dehydrogenase E1 component beta subunit